MYLCVCQRKCLVAVAERLHEMEEKQAVTERQLKQLSSQVTSNTTQVNVVTTDMQRALSYKAAIISNVQTKPPIPVQPPSIPPLKVQGMQQPGAAVFPPVGPPMQRNGRQSSVSSPGVGTNCAQ